MRNSRTLIRTALGRQLRLRDAVARVSAARANLGITRADQFPNFTVSGDITTLRNSRSGASFLGGFAETDIRQRLAQSALL